MTVGELIEKLKEFGEGEVVYLYDSDRDEYRKVDKVEIENGRVVIDWVWGSS